MESIPDLGGAASNGYPRRSSGDDDDPARREFQWSGGSPYHASFSGRFSFCISRGDSLFGAPTELPVGSEQK